MGGFDVKIRERKADTLQNAQYFKKVCSCHLLSLGH